MEGLILEALLRSARMVTLVTGALVALDSIGILISPIEQPPHKPKWSAFAWLIVGSSVGGVSGYLLLTKAGWANNGDPLSEKIVIIVLYLGAALAFTVRAMSRAMRPLLSLIAMFGMTAFGILFALEDLL